MVEWPLVFGSEFDERFLRLPERVIVTAMQSHQRYFPLGGNRFAVVAAGGDVDVIRPGYTQVLEARLEDAAFTFDRDVAVGIEELALRLDRLTFFEGVHPVRDVFVDDDSAEYAPVTAFHRQSRIMNRLARSVEALYLDHIV